ncbi:MAG: hypothetical protein EA362_02810 [Saprospirales bacterium]|nr:MAG: hypothetical protein EA362_02810 [Saprospirales bacterium]
MKILIIINDTPYGTEKAYNALRLANQINSDYPGSNLSIFLMADGVNCAISNQKTPDGYYNIEKMLKISLRKGTRLLLCGSCLDARGLQEVQLIKNAQRSTMKELTSEIMESDRVLNF